MVGLFVFAEILARVMFIPPPGSDLERRVAQCEIRTEEGRSWMECSTGDRTEIAHDERPRVVVLGGSSVRDPFKPVPGNDFPDKLQELLPSVQVINLGKPGISAAGVAWNASQLDSIDPALVVIYTAHNDYSQTVFQGAVRGTRLWLVPVIQFLNHSTLFRKLNETARGSDLKPDLEPVRVTRPESGLWHHPACRRQSDRRGTLTTTDDTALERRDEVDSRFTHDLATAIDASPAPVIVTTVLRNHDYPPQGELTQRGSGCEQALRCLQHAVEGEHADLAAYGQQLCGEESATTLWLASHAATDPAEAEALWARSLAADPLPLRAPLHADDIIATVAEETGATLVDLRPAFGTMPTHRWFTDTLHLSEEGAQKVAETLAPTVSERLGQP